ncbi:FtsX-like permease family protein [Saccharibacillus alkalitolerans]|uniref:ABC transporter permease n=1 Tax=Saccharibacillus alkalitolerans TaxID=2705290 RepID=A0ABX0FBT3_9BACL|nr:ABC transporter permease [Saccharibacillus alkalitolerans]NGZ76706.1 ABC transporter permease [Saccharibacillus alkalitolerans]
MNFPRFAYNNVKRNARAYFAYFLSSAFMVMIFFSFAVFIYHPRIVESDMHKMTKTGMAAAEYVIFAFAFFFVLYSISVFLKSRNKEFGLLLMLGAKPAHLNRLVFLENLLIGTAAIVSGIASGMLLSKLFLMLASRITETPELPFYWPLRAMLLTAAAFALLFVVISAMTLLFVRKRNVLELLQGSARPKTEPKASIWLVLLGIALLTIGFMSLRFAALSAPMLFLAAGTGIAGTYFFYSQLSVLFMRLLKRNRSFVWKKTNLLWISEMAYKIKDNARVLFLITVVTSVASMSAGFVLSIDRETKSLYTDDPYALSLMSGSDEELAQDRVKVDAVLEREGIDYQASEIRTAFVEIGGEQAGARTYLIPASDYEGVAKTWKTPAFAPGTQPEALLLHSDNRGQAPLLNAGEKLNVGADSPPLTVREVAGSGTFDAMSFGTVFIVPDAVYQDAVDHMTQDSGFRESIAYYTVPAWGDAAPRYDSEEARVGAELEKLSPRTQGKSELAGHLNVRSGTYLVYRQFMSTLSFIGVFVGLMFSLSSASFLYFKLHAELSRDAQMYRSLSKTGLSVGEMKKSATLQIALLFFIPIAVSAIQTFVVLEPILAVMKIRDITVPVLMTTAAFLIAQLCYFFLVRGRYINRLKRVMV